MRINVNGIPRDTAASDETPLLDVLRSELGLVGTRFGCGTEQCGSCMVLVDGRVAYSCTTPVSAVDGKHVTTVEGLGDESRPHPLQRAFLAEQAGPGGY